MKRRTKEELELEINTYKVYEEDGKWFGYRLCLECKKEIKYEAQESYLVLRNIRNAENNKRCCNVCCRIGNKNPFFGKKHSEKSKKQNSKSRRGKSCGNDNAMANPENRKKVSQALKKKYDSGSLDYLKEIQRSTMIKSLIGGRLKTAPVSNAEKEIKEILELLNFKVKTQFLIETLKYDFLLIDYNVIIEFNGDYWHCNPEKYDKNFLNKKKQLYAWELWERDKTKKELAEKKGYKFFTIWEKDYNINKEKEVEKIINKL